MSRVAYVLWVFEDTVQNVRTKLQHDGRDIIAWSGTLAVASRWTGTMGAGCGWF